MKKFFIALFIGTATSLIAQTWFPVGAEWTYKTISPFSYPDHFNITSIKSIKDTVINGQIATVISGSTICSVFPLEQIFYYNSTEDIVYVLIEEEFRPYFDFNKNSGESYFMYFPNFDTQILDLPYDSIEILIDSITTKIIDGQELRVQYSKGYNKYYFFRGPIIEYIGGVDGFSPESTICDMTLFAGLHCYSDETLSYFSNPIFQTQGCDYILQVPSYEEPHKLSVYPNPANEYIKLESDIGFAKIEIYNILGKCVLSQKNFNNNSVIIDIQSLHSGNYYVKVTLITDNILIHKFIKNLKR